MIELTPRPGDLTNVPCSECGRLTFAGRLCCTPRTSRVLPYEDMRLARRQILAVKDPQAQDALFTVLGLLAKLAEAYERQQPPD